MDCGSGSRSLMSDLKHFQSLKKSNRPSRRNFKINIMLGTPEFNRWRNPVHHLFGQEKHVLISLLIFNGC